MTGVWNQAARSEGQNTHSLPPHWYNKPLASATLVAVPPGGKSAELDPNPNYYLLTPYMFYGMLMIVKNTCVSGSLNKFHMVCIT
jgi:hypothetical protein